ncbi:L-serine ammonia-lyase, iron-sulfur-dependent, subunit alpha [uncultured Cloacibacillus sp.]|uniref:L-serine ammonia-lyase, iron-sulfur-dependent, subunit alpha n=1 Tax=uncultured Cloacibacillus sp. TaxID=889794 RepID=UPI0026DAEA7D|nr:L-serine ammonia-lyase, iron-sulfur-dependent, subunit alpha [uncultured Cloacibacillus sp.]
MKISSILNDVLGPIMTGPSSSHTAGPGKIAASVLQLWGQPAHNVDIIYDSLGSYPNTHVGQGSDYGFAGGLLGLSLDDPKVRDSLELAEKLGVIIKFRVCPLSGSHPNEVRIDFLDNKTHKPSMSVLCFSTGGGTFQIVELDGFPILHDGQRKRYYVACSIQVQDNIRQILKKAKAIFNIREANTSGVTSLTLPSNDAVMFEIEASSLPNKVINEIRGFNGVYYVREVEPVVPVPLKLQSQATFSTAEEALVYASEHDITSLSDLAIVYEESLGHANRETLQKKMESVLSAMRKSMSPPADDETVPQYLVPRQAKVLKTKIPPIDMGVINSCMGNAMAVMENACAHRVIVAAPTAGSSGVIPACIVGIAETLGFSDDKILDALWGAGLIGAFIANQATFAAEVAGCQAEIGSSACMASAGVTSLMGGSIQECCNAASIAMQSMLGLICDPVAGLVEVPCIARNITATAVTVMSANMALCDVKSPISLDETIQTMLEVGNDLPASLKCTCNGGLCTTKTGKVLEEQVKKSRV